MKAASPYSPRVSGRQVEKLLGGDSPAESETMIQAGPGSFLISLA